MLVKTKYFSEIDLAEEKIITFENGIMGFEEYKKYTILYDIETKGKQGISWLQSIEEENLALPVVYPFAIKSDYNPIIEEEILKMLGELNNENLVILLCVTLSPDKKKITVNLKAPFIINSNTRKGCQIIVNNEDYPIKYNLYEAVQRMKEERGEV